MTVQNTLDERAKTHGSFEKNAAASRALKMAVIVFNEPHIFLTDVEHEALDNICQKIARIITGNPKHADSWEDIAGYALLAKQSVEAEAANGGS